MATDGAALRCLVFRLIQSRQSAVINDSKPEMIHDFYSSYQIPDSFHTVLLRFDVHTFSLGHVAVLLVSEYSGRINRTRQQLVG